MRQLINDFSGGLNTRFRGNRIADNQSPELRNIRYTRLGALTKKFGSSIIAVNAGSTTGAAFTAYAYALTGMTAEAMLVSTQESPGAFWKTVNGTTFTSVFVFTGVDFTAQNWPIHFATFGDLVYIFADWMNTRSWDNSTLTAITASTTVFPRTRHAAIFKNRIFAGYIYDGSGTRKSRLKWSNYADATIWVATNFEDIYANDGTIITAIFTYGDELLIFKGPEFANQSFMHSKMFRLQGDTFDAANPQYSLDTIPLPPGVGLLSSDSIQIYQGRLIFLCNDGFYEYLGGGMAPKKISEIIQDDIDDISTSTFNEYDSRAASFVFNNRYYCSVRSTRNSSEGYNNRTYILDGDTWFMDIISSTADSFATGDGAGVYYTKFLGSIYMVPPTTSTINGILTGTIRRLEIDAQFTENTQNDASANVNASYLTKEFDLVNEVQFDTCFVHLRRQSSGTLTFEVNVDQREAVATSIDMTAPDTGNTENSSSNLLRKQVLIGKRGRTIQFRFHNLANTDFEIYGIELYYAGVPSTRQALI